MQATLNKLNRIDHFPNQARQVEKLAHAIVDAHEHFFRRAHRFEFYCRGGYLVIRGCVPSFYLKQQLQAALMELAEICQIDNQVSVISSFGLSSVGAFDD